MVVCQLGFGSTTTKESERNSGRLGGSDVPEPEGGAGTLARTYVSRFRYKNDDQKLMQIYIKIAKNTRENRHLRTSFVHVTFDKRRARARKPEPGGKVGQAQTPMGPRRGLNTTQRVLFR